MATTKQTATHNKKRKFNVLTESQSDNSNDPELSSKRQKIDTKNNNDNNTNIPSLPTDVIITKLSNILDEIEQPSHLSVGGISNSLPLIPELIVDGIGHIPLPISDTQLPLLIATCDKSSFGHGLQTENDENVRKSYELTANKFKFNNPIWNKKIKELVNNVSSQLGCDSLENIQAHCYKLLIYEKDGHFVEHRDTQKIDGMFATLIIQLPCNYKNIGNKPTLIIKHKNKKIKYYFGSNKNKNDIKHCKYNIYYSAHFCDLQHLVNKIEYGYRIAVTYNLCWDGPKNMIPKISKFEHLTLKINNILNAWNGKNAIAINLEHLYTSHELNRDGINALKGSDAARVHTIKSSVSKQLGLRFFVAEVTRTVEEYDTGGCGYSGYGYSGCDWEESEREETVNDEWYSSNGEIFKFGKYINIDLSIDCIGYDEDEEWEEIDQTQEGYLGNEGATQSTTYSKYIAIFFRSQNMFELLLNGNKGIEAGLEWIKYLITKKENIKPLITHIINHFNVNNHKSQIISILKVLKECNELKLLTQFINKLIEYNIGLSYSYSHYYNTSKNNVVQLTHEIIIKYGWIESIKCVMLKWFNCVLTDGENSINSYYKLLVLIKTANMKNNLNKNSNEKKESDSDDDIVILSNTNTNTNTNKVEIPCLDECYQDLLHKLWDNVKIKLGLMNNGKIIAKMDANNIGCVVRLMIDVNAKKEEKILFDNIYQENVTQNMQQQVINGIIKWTNKLLLKMKCIQLIFMHRMNYLKIEIAKGEPKFSWKMSSTGSSYHTDLANFLTSERQSFTKTGFNSIGHARNWARKYGGYKCSINCVTGGRGSSAYVQVTKNRNYFNGLMSVYKQKMNEMKSLMSMINK